MVTSMHLVEASVEVRATLLRHVVFEKDTVAVAWRLVFLVHILIVCSSNLVGGKERDRLLNVAWIVPLFSSLNKLVLLWYPADCNLSHIGVVQFRKACLETVVQVTHVEIEVTDLV